MDLGFFIRFICLMDGGNAVAERGTPIQLCDFVGAGRAVRAAGEVGGVDLQDAAFGIPAVLTMTIQPRTSGVTNSVGFSSSSLIRVAQGRTRDISCMPWIATAGLLLYPLRS